MANAFIQEVEGDILAVGTAAWDFVKNKLIGYAVDELTILRDVVQEAINDASEGDSVETIVTKCLNLLALREATELGKIETDVLKALVSLGLVKA